jgi:putative DNA methylase
MTWDFAEANVFSDSSGNFFGGVETIESILQALVPSRSGIVLQRSATALEGTGFVFSTDPPYYDNVPYADLSDFFYIWLRRCLHPVYPQLLGTVLVPKAEELVADPFRQGGKEEARSFFERGMGRVFERVREASNPLFPATIYYAFKQAEGEEAAVEADGEENSSELARASTGWETFLQGLADAGWQIDGTWPMRSELGNRMRNLASNALASSIVLVCRVRPKDAGVASRRDFLAALKRELPDALRNLQKGNIAPVDLAQAAIGPGMAVFSRYARVLETDGSPMGVRTALSLINQSLDEVLAEQEGEFDADTRWALAWFDQYGFTEGAYGQAETLSTAKNTSVSGMVEAGILAAKGGKVRLLKREELAADWSPATDDRLTVWEATHHLIRSLDSGEAVAAGLLKQLGAVAEVARDLSYRLYTVCERRKWAQEAIGYNALVLSWPDLKRLADEQRAAGPSQAELI